MLSQAVADPPWLRSMSVLVTSGERDLRPQFMCKEVISKSCYDTACQVFHDCIKRVE